MRTAGLWILAAGVLVGVGSYLADVPVTMGLTLFALGLLLIAIGKRKPAPDGPAGRRER
jgi:hypothetical protein